MDRPNPPAFNDRYTNRKLLGGFWKLAKPYWFSEEKWPALGLLSVVVTLTLGWVYLMVRINTWYQEFYDAVQKMNEKAYWSLIVKFCYLAAAAILIWVYRQYCTQMLQNRWRRWMTRRFLEKWLSEKSHYLWQHTGKMTDNPDQRISEDVRDFVNNSLDLSIGLLNQVVTFFSFIAILWTLSGPLAIPLGGGHTFSLPGYMAWACLFYSVAGTWVTHRVGKPLIDLNYRQQMKEANFRFSLVRLRENGESVALSDGEAMEEHGLKGHFEWVYTNFRSIIRKQMHLGYFTSTYDQIAVIFPLVVAAPKFFAKQIGFGGLIQVSNAFGQVRDALSWVVANYSTLAYWRSVVERLDGFEAEVENTKTLHIRARSVLEKAPGVFRLESMNLYLPGSDRPLVGPLNVEFKKGHSVLISGPSGCGKSTLLRALSGLWPFAKGKVVLPDDESVMVMPQKPYLPVGTLRGALAYPKSETEVPEEEVLQTLDLCRLGHLKDQLSVAENWALVLSVGEQQRVAWARVFLQKPQWLFLDEATSALDEESQNWLYATLKDRLPGTTLVSVAHSQNPQEHHEKVWHILSDPEPKLV